jgi:hypothetical protein
MERIEVVVGLSFALGDEGGETNAAVGILHPEKRVLTNGGVQQSFVGEDAPFFFQKLGNREYAGIRFG